MKIVNEINTGYDHILIDDKGRHYVLIDQVERKKDKHKTEVPF